MTPSSRTLLAAAIGLFLTPAGAAEPKRPKLDLRVIPLMGPPSTEFVFVADLKGGADAEDFYCPTLEWQWDSQDTSLQEPECPPFQPGVTRVERRFSMTRTFTTEGSRSATLVLRRGDKVLGRASASFRVTWEKKPPSATIRDPRSN